MTSFPPCRRRKDTGTLCLIWNRQHKIQKFQVGHRYSIENGCDRRILSSFSSVLIRNSWCTTSTVAPHANNRDHGSKDELPLFLATNLDF